MYPLEKRKTGHSLSGRVRFHRTFVSVCVQFIMPPPASITMTGFGFRHFGHLISILVPGDIRPTNSKCLHVGHRSSCIGSGGALPHCPHLPPAAVHANSASIRSFCDRSSLVLRAQFFDFGFDHRQRFFGIALSTRSSRISMSDAACRSFSAAMSARSSVTSSRERFRLRLSRRANA